MKKKAAVIGYGGMGAGFHCKHLSESDVCTLAGIYDIDPKKFFLNYQETTPSAWGWL